MNTRANTLKTFFLAIMAAIALAMFSLNPALAAGDATKGKKVFVKCKACHSIDAEKHKVGPHLVNVIGRKAGTVDGFKKYSKAMKESGIVWDETTLDAYLENPRKVVKGGSMAFAGLRRKPDRDNLIAYLKEFSK